MPIDQTTQRLLQSLAPQHSNPAPTPPVATPPAVVPTPSTPPLQPSQTVSTRDEELAQLDQILAEAEQTAPQAVPTAMLQTVADATQALTPAAGSGNKETITPAGVKNVVEAGGSAQYVEYEPNPELPPEVEGYLNKTEQHSDQAPPEIVIADSIASMPTNHQLPSQPVVVLPITPEVEKIGMTKTPQFSIRWLVEWSRKIMKIFVGKVIYFQKK